MLLWGRFLWYSRSVFWLRLFPWRPPDVSLPELFLFELWKLLCFIDIIWPNGALSLPNPSFLVYILHSTVLYWLWPGIALFFDPKFVVFLNSDLPGGENALSWDFGYAIVWFRFVYFKLVLIVFGWRLYAACALSIWPLNSLIFCMSNFGIEMPWVLL